MSEDRIRYKTVSCRLSEKDYREFRTALSMKGITIYTFLRRVIDLCARGELDWVLDRINASMPVEAQNQEKDAIVRGFDDPDYESVIAERREHNRKVAANLAEKSVQ